MSVCIHWFPASNETEPPKTIMKNSNNITQEWNNCGQSYTSVKIFPPFWMCCQRLPVVWQAPYSPWQGEDFSPQRSECRGPCCDCFWVDSALWEPNLCLALRLAGFGSLLVGVLEAAWCQLCLGPHAWTPVALRICRRNREGAQRESYGCKTRFCFQKHTFFSFRFLTGVKKCELPEIWKQLKPFVSPRFCSSSFLAFFLDFQIKNWLPLKSETIHSLICAY